MSRYPNLQELITYYPCGEPAVCDHAGIEPELLHVVLQGEEALTSIEVMRLSRLYRCSASVITCPSLIMLDMGRYRHKKIAWRVNSIFMQLKCMAEGGNKEAEKYLQWTDWEQQRFLRAIHEDRLSYGHYFGIKEEFSQYVQFATPKLRRRGEGGPVCQ